MKIRNILFLGGICVLVLVGMIVYIRNSDRNAQLPLLTLEEFELLLNSESSGEKYIYVGRDSCPTCSLVYPALCDIQKEKSLDIYYYSTEPDRDMRAEEMYSLLNHVNVDYVPSVIVLSQGTVRSVVDGEEFVNQFLAEGGQYE